MIRKAVFPVAGLGTRFLPVTKSVPKEMLPVLEKPLIQYVVEEARAAGISEFIMVIARGKDALAHHFDASPDLERQLIDAEKDDLYNALINVKPRAHESFVFVRQNEPKGFGHAVLCAAPCIGNEPFAILLPDDFIDPKNNVLKQMVNARMAHDSNIIAAMEVSPEEVSRYGIFDINQSEAYIELIPAHGLIEKPSQQQAPSCLAAIGRYVLQPEIFNVLANQKEGHGGEIQLTDALAALVPTRGLYAFRFQGERFDCGTREGWLAAQMAMAFHDEKLRNTLKTVFHSLEHNYSQVESRKHAQ